MKEESNVQWPWESGEIFEAPAPEPPAFATAIPRYTLPSVRDRKAEGGRRPVTARELARIKRERELGEAGYFQR